MGAVTVLSSPIVPHRPATFLHNSAVCSFMMSATAGELPGSHCLTPVSCCNWRVEISDNGLIFFSLSPTPTSKQPINNTCFMKSYLLLVENNQRQTPQEAFNSLVRYYLDQGIKPQIKSPLDSMVLQTVNCRGGSSLWFCYQTPTWHVEQSAWARDKDDPQNFRPQRGKEGTSLVLKVFWVLRWFTPEVDFQCVGRERWVFCDGPALSTDLATLVSVTVGTLVPLDLHALISEWGEFTGWLWGSHEVRCMCRTHNTQFITETKTAKQATCSSVFFLLSNVKRRLGRWSWREALFVLCCLFLWCPLKCMSILTEGLHMVKRLCPGRKEMSPNVLPCHF